MHRSLSKAALAVLVAVAACAARPAKSAPEPTLMQHCYIEGMPVEVPVCSDPRPVPWPSLPIKVFIDPDYPNPEFVGAAALSWNFYLGAEVFVPAKDLGDADIVVRYYPPNPLTNWAGLTSWRVVDGRAFVLISLYGEYNHHVQVIEHELGHALGLEHDPDKKRSIMYPSADFDRPTLTDADLAALRKHLGIKVKAKAK